MREGGDDSPPWLGLPRLTPGGWSGVGIEDEDAVRGRPPGETPTPLPGKIRHSVTNELLLRNSQIHPSHDPSRDGCKRHKA
jgi:hypothetical protein